MQADRVLGHFLRDVLTVSCRAAILTLSEEADISYNVFNRVCNAAAQTCQCSQLITLNLSQSRWALGLCDELLVFLATSPKVVQAVLQFR